MTGKSGTWRLPAPGNSPEPGDLHYLHPLVPRPGSTLSPPRARARCRAQQYIPAAQLARPPPSFPSSPPPVEGPERAPAVNSPGTPLGAGGRARSPPPDPAPPRPAQAVACAAAESPAPSSAAWSLPLLARAVRPPSPRNPIPRRTLLTRLHCLSQCLVLDPNFTFRAKTTPNCSYGARSASDSSALLSTSAPSLGVSSVPTAPKCQVPLLAITTGLVINCSQSH